MARIPAWLRLAQAVEHAGGGKTVRNEADRGLKIADGDAGARAEEAVGGADIETVAGELLLQLVALVEREHALVARPILHERRAAAQPVGEIADGERVSFGGIVFHDDAEILQHQERRPASAGGNEQEGAVVAMRERLVAGAPYAEILPFAHRHLF